MLVLIGAGQCSSQTVQPLLQPRQTFTAPGGFPCANCLLYSYAAGSTTPLDTYSDSTGLVRNQNPVPLDSSGSASIWTGNNSYKFVLKTADATPVWTVDNVSGLISGSGGGSMVYPGSGIPVSTGAAWSTSLTAPSGALVGTTDAQALTNKTLDGVSPTTMSYVDPTSSVQTQLNGKALAAAAITVNGTSCALSSTCTVADSTKVPTTRTVNGHALSANVTVAYADLGNLPVGNLNSGTSASGSTFWRGDGTWAAPATGVTDINGTAGSYTFTGAGVSCTSTTCTFSGAGTGVSSINTVTGAFTFTGSGVSCTSTTCTFSGTGAGMNFNGLTSGTNTAAAMLVGTGASLGTTGSGTIAATSLSANLPVGNLDSGTGASSSTYWRGDGTWGTPAGTGTVTSFSAGNLSPLFTSSVATSTTTPALTFALSNAAAGTVFGNPTGGSAAPSFTSAPVVTSVQATTYYTTAEHSDGTCTTALTINPINGNRQKFTLTNGSTCALTFTQPASGTALVQLKITQSAISTFDGRISGCKWPGGTVPTITPTSAAVDMVSVFLDGTNAYCQIAQAFQ